MKRLTDEVRDEREADVKREPAEEDEAAIASVRVSDEPWSEADY